MKFESFCPDQQDQRGFETSVWFPVVCRLIKCLSCLLFRCSCGQLVAQHTSIPAGAKEGGSPLVQLEVQPAERWSPLKHTQTSPTDAYGVIEFQGGGHVNKAMVQ